VVELCALAGMPGKALDLLAKQVSPAEARKSLMVARAAEEAPDVRSHVMPDTGTKTSATLKDNPVMKAVERLTGKGVK
jgi:capsid assembly protease